MHPTNTTFACPQSRSALYRRVSFFYFVCQTHLIIFCVTKFAPKWTFTTKSIPSTPYCKLPIIPNRPECVFCHNKGFDEMAFFQFGELVLSHNSKSKLDRTCSVDKSVIPECLECRITPSASTLAVYRLQKAT